MYGGIEKVIKNREVAFFGNKDYSYTYNNISHDHKPMPEKIGVLNENLQKHCSHPINSTGVNVYLNGQGIGKHSDSEVDVIPESTIASVSLGTVTAQMRFTHKLTNEKVDSGILFS